MPSRVVVMSLALAWVGTTGCAFKYEFRTGLPPGDREVSELRHIGMWGHVGGSEPFDLHAACPEGTASFGSQITFLNWLPAFFSLGTYSPRTVTAVCAKGEGAQ